MTSRTYNNARRSEDVPTRVTRQIDGTSSRYWKERWLAFLIFGTGTSCISVNPTSFRKCPVPTPTSHPRLHSASQYSNHWKQQCTAMSPTKSSSHPCYRTKSRLLSQLESQGTEEMHLPVQLPTLYARIAKSSSIHCHMGREGIPILTM